MTPRLVPLPRAIRLPSGRKLALHERDDARGEPTPPEDGPIAAAFDHVVHRIELREADRPTPFADLALEDAHVIRALLAKLGRVDEPPVEVTCENCEARHVTQPSSSTELAPYLDDQLGDAELDATFPFDEPLAIPGVRTGRGVATDVVLARRTVSEAEPVWRRAPEDPPPMTPRLVAAMGIRRLGRETRLSRIADALARASDEARAAVFDHFESAHYGPRLVGSVRCTCGARVFVPSPAPSEMGERHAVRRDPASAGPSFAAFDAHVAACVELVFARRRIRNVNVVVETGVPACDAGGTPLLGSYGPADFDEAPPEVRLYYRTFCSEVAADPSFDWKAEVEETIDHELEHHENFLAGDDPLDDEERATIAREEERRVGKEELVRRAMSEVVSDGFSFVRHAWPLLVLLLVLGLVMYGR